MADEVTTLAEYHSMEQRFEALGMRRGRHREDPICRWRDGDLVVDLMPLDETVLGFGNRWYRSAIAHRTSTRLTGGVTLHHIDAPHFIATKLDAYVSRGGRDSLTSTDLEDVVRVVDGRPELLDEMARACSELRSFVGGELRLALKDRFFLEALPTHFESREEAAGRLPVLVERLRRLAIG